MIIRIPFCFSDGDIDIDTISGPLIVSISEEEKALPLSIPERYRDGVAALAALSKEAFTDLLNGIQGGLVADNATDVAGQLEKKFPSLRKNGDLSKIVLAVASLQSLLQMSHASAKRLSRDIPEALSTDAPELAKKIDAKTLSERVRKVIDARNVHLTEEKVQELQSEVPNVYCTGRVLTDVRGVFTDNPSIPPTGMTIIHTLRLGYHDDTTKHREFYVALDKDDLEGLKIAIERAQEKTKTLESLLTKSGCKVFD
jgi:hypothetical protein